MMWFGLVDRREMGEEKREEGGEGNSTASRSGSMRLYDDHAEVSNPSKGSAMVIFTLWTQYQDKSNEV